MPYVEVDIDLDMFDDDDLVEELENRGFKLSLGGEDIVRQMYDNQKLGKPIDKLLELLYDRVLGRII